MANKKIEGNRVLVIPDVHLKPKMFKRAARIMRSGQADYAIVLGDIVDSWYQDQNIELYEETMRAALKFHKDFNNTVWLWGNHDYSYQYNMPQSGYSYMAAPYVKAWLKDYTKKCNLHLVHLDGGVIFSHGGLTKTFVMRRLTTCYPTDKLELYNDEGLVMELVEQADCDELWLDTSPLWARPQITDHMLYRRDDFLQVVGHTPMHRVEYDTDINVVSTDTFSTPRRRGDFEPESKFIIVDTATKKWQYAEEK